MRKVHLVVLDVRAPQAGHPGDLGCVMGKEASELSEGGLGAPHGGRPKGEGDLVQVSLQGGGQHRRHLRPLLGATGRMHPGQCVAELDGWRLEDAHVEQSGLDAIEGLGERQAQLAVRPLPLCRVDQGRATLLELCPSQSVRADPVQRAELGHVRPLGHRRGAFEAERDRRVQERVGEHRVVTQRDIAQEGSAHDHVVSAGGGALGDEQPGYEVADPQMQSALCLERQRCPVLRRADPGAERSCRPQRLGVGVDANSSQRLHVVVHQL